MKTPYSKKWQAWRAYRKVRLQNINDRHAKENAPRVNPTKKLCRSAQPLIARVSTFRRKYNLA